MLINIRFATDRCWESYDKVWIDHAIGELHIERARRLTNWQKVVQDARAARNVRAALRGSTPGRNR